MKELKELKIDSELRDLLPPLTVEEFNQLEENIVKDGCQSPLFIWNNYIADGHNRYSICQKHKIPFESISLAFKEKSEVMRWMIDGQLGRRNLTPIQRVAVAEKYRPIYEKQAEDNLSKAGQSFSPKEGSANLPKVDIKIDTRKELSKLAGVGERTYGKADREILKSDNEKVKQEVLSGEKSIDAGYNEIKGKIITITQETKRKVCVYCDIEKTLDEFYVGHDKCKDCEQKDYEKRAKKSQNINNTIIDEVIKDVKTARNVEDYINVESEIECIEMSCNELYEQIDSRFFTMIDVINKMDREQIDLVIDVLNEHINKIIKLKNKFENREDNENNE